MAEKAPSEAAGEEVDYIEEVEYEEVEITDEEDDEGDDQGDTSTAAPAPTAAHSELSSPANEAEAVSAGATAPAAQAAAEGDLAAGGNSSAAHVSRATSLQGEALTVDKQASKMATDVALLASEVAHKLQGGLLQAFSGATATVSSSSSNPRADESANPTAAPTKAAAAAAAAAAADLGSKLTSGLSGLGSWWQNIDQSLASNNKPLTTPEGSPARKLATSVTPESQLLELFSLNPNEALVDSYSCALLQTYSCSHNSLTPPMQISFDGKLYITDKHTCFQATSDQAAADSSSSGGGGGGSSSSGGNSSSVPKQKRKPPAPLVFKIAHSDVASSTREPSPSPRGKSLVAADVLRIVVNASSSSSSSGAIREGSMGSSEAGAVQWSISFQAFDPPGALDGALALIEHLREG